MKFSKTHLECYTKKKIKIKRKLQWLKMDFLQRTKPTPNFSENLPGTFLDLLCGKKQ